MNKLKTVGFTIIVFLSFCKFAGATENEFMQLSPNKVVMLNYKSKVDNTLQPLLVKTPVNYSTNKAWPLLVVLHGYGDGPVIAPKMDTMIQIGPYGRGDEWYRGIGEKDVFESIEFAKTIMPVDEDRIYLAGFSMGGYGTFRLASRFPDVWAACVPVCPRVPNDFYLENCSNLPFWIHTGQKDHRLPPEPCAKLYLDSQKAEIKDWLYTEHKGMGHSFSINWEDVEKWLLKCKKNTLPKEIGFTTSDFDANSAYWIEIVQLQNTELPAVFRGKIDGDDINVIIDNINALKIDISSSIARSDVVVNKIIIKDNGGKVVFSGKMPEDGKFIYKKME